MQQNKKPQLISLDQAAEMLGMSRSWLTKELTRGTVPGYQYRPNSRWILYREDIEEYKKKHFNQR